jgi:hypothetical protein
MKKTDTKVGISRLKNQVVKEAKRIGKVAIPAKVKILTAIDSRITILPKNKEGVKVTAI